MAFLSEDELREMGFAHVGKNVKISRDARIYFPASVSIGDNSRIDDFVVISGKVTIGRNVHIAVLCSISGGTEGLEIGDFAGLAYGCHVFAQSDDYSGASLTNPTVPAKYKKEKKSSVKIEKHVIVGANSTVLPGVTLSEGCSVGSMSMVTKTTEPWKVYFGIPAKPIKNRKKDLLALEQDYLASEGA